MGYFCTLSGECQAASVFQGAVLSISKNLRKETAHKAAKAGTHVHMELKSSAFENGSLIDQKYTCDGQDLSPPLTWSNAPEGTQSFVLICDDPDAPMGTWDHWIIFNLPASTTSLAEAIKTFPQGTLFGTNSWGRQDYGGPCPPDREHRYFFKLYALDKVLDLPHGATKEQVLKAMDIHILSQAALIGKYNRPQNNR